jgi:AhpD family alkylhydroperoxidase
MSETAARIPLLERDQVSGEVGTVYDALLAQRGVVPNMFKTLAYTPGLALGVAAFLKPLLGDGALPGWYKELVATRVAVLHQSEYAIASHSSLARQKGANPEQVSGTVDPDRGPYSEREKLGFECADRLHRGSAELDSKFFATLKEHFSEPELVELVAVCAAFQFFTRFVDGLKIPVTPAATTPASIRG